MVATADNSAANDAGPAVMNDTGGWRLVHDQIRWVLDDALAQVGALREDDPAAVKVFVKWWASFSRSLAHHMHTEDDRIWPTITAASPGSASELSRLHEEHASVEAQLQRVDALVGSLPVSSFDSTALASALDALRDVVADHLGHEEATAFVVGATAVSPPEWHQIEQDMVKGLAMRDVATLLPRLLDHAEPGERATMLRRLPPPVRVLDAAVFEPRYRRIRASLPLAHA